MIADPDRIPEIALDWARAGKGAALATVVETWGSAPRPKGSQLVISGDGEMMGSVSGGCVEGAVVAEALEALGDGTPRVLRVRGQRPGRLRRRAGLRRHHPGDGRADRRRAGAGPRPAGAAGRRPGGARAGGLCGAARKLGAAAGPRAGRCALGCGAGRAGRRPFGDRGGVVPRRAQPAAADGGGGGGAYRPGAGADGADGRLRRGRRGPARGVRQRGAVSGYAGCSTTGRTRRWRRSGSTAAPRW